MRKKDILDYNKRIQTLVVIDNCVTITCFTILSILFNKWWLIFFSMLFLSEIGTKGDE